MQFKNNNIDNQKKKKQLLTTVDPSHFERNDA